MEFILTVIGYFIGGWFYVPIVFAITKLLFRNRVISYLLCGVTAEVMYLIMLFRETPYKIGVIICMILAAIFTLVFVIGERMALASGKHNGDFEHDRGARKFQPKLLSIPNIKDIYMKYPYPFLKEKSLFRKIKFFDTFIRSFDSINDIDPAYQSEARKQTLGLMTVFGIFLLFGLLLRYGIIAGWYMILSVLYLMYAVVWLSYFSCYCCYWMVTAIIDTLKELYTKEGSQFSLRSAISDIANSDELASAGSFISDLGSRAASAIHRKGSDQSGAEPLKPTDSQAPAPEQQSPYTENSSDEQQAPPVQEPLNNDSPQQEQQPVSPLNYESPEPAPCQPQSPARQPEPEINNSQSYAQNLENSPAPPVNSSGYSQQSPQPAYSANNSTYTQPVKSKTTPIMLAVITVLLLIIGVLLGLFLFKGNTNSDNTSSSDNSSRSETPAPVTSAEETSAQTAETETTAAPTTDITTAQTDESTVPTTQETKPVFPYAGYEYIDKAPADMEFFEGSSVQTGIINTKETGLNLRSGPSTSDKILLEIPKGESVDILGMNNEWCYVKWSAYAAGLRQDIDYYGYVSKQFISIDGSAPPQITPVEKYGTISSPGGYKTVGLSKSYLIDGGAEEYVRRDLTDGWHIKAVNEYYDGEFLWYELYDADDGDYYGWVNQQVINFY